MVQAYEQLQSVLATSKESVEDPAQLPSKDQARRTQKPASAHKNSHKNPRAQKTDAPPPAEDQSIRDVFNCIAHGT